MKPTKQTIGKLRELILKSEGKTSEDELVFGCRYKDNQFDYCILVHKGDGKLYSFSSMGHAHDFVFPLDEEEEDWRKYKVHTIEEAKDFEILGLPITIARIMRASEEAEKKYRGLMVFINTKGEIFFDDNIFSQPVAHWNLEKDDANEQEEEDLLSIIKLLNETI